MSETGFHGISLESASTDNHFTNLLCEDNERYAISTSYDSNHCTYTNITANRNRWGGISISTTDNILQDITVINNLYSGLQVWKDRNNITNVNATNNTGHGIQMNSKNNILTNVTTNRNLMEGIYLQSLSENNEFTGITAIDNAENGIFLNAASNNRLANLTSVGNKQGILLENAENNNISTCRFIDNAQYGAYLNNSGYNAFWDNNFTNNGINAYEDITSINSWNNSETGNNWDDFENNNGHPYTYIIDGPGDGIDWHPNGASTYISLSDCAVLSSPGETYILTADIINHTDHACMDISANNVVLDCLGHLIDGDDNAQIGIGIVRGSEEVTNITVKNCVLSDWKYETIKIYRGHQNILENINMSSGTEDGLWMYFSDNNRVTGMKSTDNPGLGFVISDSDYNNFTDIVANNNVGGIYAQRTNYFNFENIDVNNNSFGGLVLQEASNNKIIDLNVNNSQHLVFGSIHIWLDSDNNIFRNVVTQNNVAGGITIENSDNNSFTNVTINNNQNGVSLQDSDYNTFWNNNFMNNNVSAYEDSTSNDNSWNLSEVGNYWDDFINNSGYPTHYNISGPGDGIDWWPIWTFINEPPVLAPIGNREVNESETLIIDVDATDPENYTLTYYTNAGDVLPSAFAFNATTGIFEWTPTKWDPGIYEVTFNVTDGELWDEETITITVVIEKHFYAGYGLGVPYNYYDNITGGGVCNIFGGCEPIIDGFDYTDSAFCLGQNYCVLDGVCYPGDGSVILDIDGSSKHEAICVGFGWWDLDAGGGDSNDPTPLPGMEVCELGNHTWAKAGKNPVSSVGEYEWSFNDWGCCGDDNGEHFGCNTDFPEICACCNDQNDIVGYDGSCVQTKKAKLKKESEVVEPPIKEPTQRTASRG